MLYQIYPPELFRWTGHGLASGFRPVLGMVRKEPAEAEVPAPRVLHVAVGLDLRVYFSIPGIFPPFLSPFLFFPLFSNL